MKHLDDQQIASLFDFVKSKYVRYIDVQHELVDHLASDIEIEMEADNSLTFDKSLQKVYSKFPISGFSNYVSAAEKSMHSYWMKNILGQFIKFGGLPFVFSLMVLSYLQYQFIVAFGTVAFIILIVLIVALSLLSSSRLTNIAKDSNKRNVRSF